MQQMTTEEKHDTIFGENDLPEQQGPAEIDFGLLETHGKWLVKVVSGPNGGAEFSLQPGTSYLIGTDPASCDIVFSDLSVSRQHGRLTADAEEKITLEDLQSKNGTFVDGEKISGKKELHANALVSMGTTTFMLIDREGERHTIVSPLPEMMKKKEQVEEKQADAPNMGAIQAAVMGPIVSEVERIKEEEKRVAKRAQAMSTLVILATVTGLFLIVGVGTMMLFRTQAVVKPVEMHAEEDISKALKAYPAIRFSYNPGNGKLLLLGHLQSAVERNTMMNGLSQLKFINDVDSSNVVIDEFVWNEINQLIAKNSEWRTVTVSSPVAGRFQITGFLKTKKQADALYEYVTLNFPYSDLLERKVIVEEELRNTIVQKLIDNGFRSIKLDFSNGELTLVGSVSQGTLKDFNKLVDEFRKMPGVRTVSMMVTEASAGQALINISDKYSVSGYSSQGKNISVVVNGRILMKGDTLDGMEVLEIQPNAIILRRDDFKYKIEFNR